MDDRALASVALITNIQPIPDADSIEVATVRGWDVVVRKGDFQVGELVLYYEIDSLLPIRPEFEFLRASSYRKVSNELEGFRLKTMKFRGQISQGLLTKIPEAYADAKEGDDLTEALGIVKFEPPIPDELIGKVEGFFPSFIPKTNQRRIQNLKYVPTSDLFLTEKVNGESLTVYLRNGVFGICSRNYELKKEDEIVVPENPEWPPKPNYYRITAEEWGLEDKLRMLGRNLALQGELVGPGCKNVYKLSERKIFFFTAYDIDLGQKLSPEDLESLLGKMCLEMVPVLDRSLEISAPDPLNFLLNYASGKSKLNPKVDREGLVIHHGLTSFKVISNKYLLKYGE